MRTGVIAWMVGALSVLAASAHAQDEVEGSASASGSAGIELGATQASDVEMGIDTRRGAAPAAYQGGGGGGGGGGGLRLGVQLRLNAVNVLEFTNVVGNSVFDSSQVPLITPGVRILDGKLFLGAGLGFNAIDDDPDGPSEESRSGFTFSPLASYDLIEDSAGALSLLGWLNLSSLGETEDCNAGGCQDQNDDAFGWGLNLGAGIRGFLSPGLAIGGEFGWGFLSVASDAGGDVFAHGIFGTLLFEASVGL